MMQAEGGQIASFREIHKNAWLKRIPPNSNNKLLGQKKVTVERWWTVFCIHGDVEPFLEGYTEAGAVAASHMPRWRIPLARVIHVSGSVGPARPHAEYEFVVALQDGAIRLIAPSWDSMQDWVDTLRNKLREMKILSPKENVYSKAPEQVRPRAPTRDPTSPLPAPPPGPTIRVPGIEPSIRPLPGPSSELSTACDETNSFISTLNESSSSGTNGVLCNSAPVENLESTFPIIESNEGSSHLVESCSSDTNFPFSSNLNTQKNQETKDTCVNSVNNYISKNDKLNLKSKNIPKKSECQDSSRKTDVLHELAESSSHQNDLKYTLTLIDSAGASNLELENGPSTSIDFSNTVSSQKSIDNSISKVEMDFSGLVFCSEFPNNSNLRNNAASGSSVQSNSDHVNIVRGELLNQKSTEFTSSVANVSGMNICLTDSVLEHRMKAESNIEFFTEFDVDDSSPIPSTSTNYSNIIITDNKDSKVKYSQVDLKAKHAKSEKLKQNLNEPLPSNMNINNIIIKKASSQSSTQLKPAVSPRTIIFKNCDKGLSTNATQSHLPNENQAIKKGSFTDESTPNHFKSSEISETTAVSERNKAVQNKMSISEYQATVNVSERMNFEEQTSTPCASNVTIISVSNDLKENDRSVLNRVIINDGLIKIDPKVNHNLEKNKIQSDCNYVNVSTNFQCNSINTIQVKADNTTIKSQSKLLNDIDEKSKMKNKNENNDSSNIQVFLGPEYGHTEQSISVGARNESTFSNLNRSSEVNNKCIKNQFISSSRLSPVNNFQSNIYDEKNVITELTEELANDVQKLTNASVLEIEHGASNNNKFAFDQDFVHSVNFINASLFPNTPRQFENNFSTVEINNPTTMVTKNDQFYESVFTPFMVSKGPNVILEQKYSNEEPSGRLTAIEKSANSNNLPKNESNPHNYEFLSWKNNVEMESFNINEPGSSAKFQSITNNRETQSEINVVNDTNIDQNTRESVTMQDINLSEYRPQTVAKKNEDFSQEKLHPSSKIGKHGLFTRGLTELNIVSKFRNMSQSHSSKAPLLKNSQFYSYVELDPPPGTSTEAKPSLERKNGAFTAKFNNLFSKTSDDKASSAKDVIHGKPLEFKQVMRVESSLRRNWSEHNDRTILPVVKTAAELKAHRSRPGVNNSSQNVFNDSLEKRQTRRRSSSLSESHTTSDDSSCNLVEAVNSSSNNNTDGNSLILLRPKSLREQQVARLRGEMAHIGGVRLRLRTGDCPGEAIALADAYGTVWVCGWKQRTHPLLYNALHIGDRLGTVGGVPITSVRQAKHALKDTSSGLYYVELVIKRLPHGRAYTLKKDSDSQDLGLIMESAEIIGIVPRSPAAQAGVLPNGTLTEVNGRPLNLLLKKGDTQVRDRLNAIGRDISILVQPTEFVALLKASLRCIRGHKDYIVQ